MPGRRWVLLLAASVGGCASPFSRDDADAILRRRVEAAIELETRSMATGDRLIEATQPPPEVERSLADRMPELEKIGPRIPYPAGKLDMGPDLAGRRQQEVAISLEAVIHSAVDNNLSIQIARLQPAITEADVVAAEAVFDAVFFGQADASFIDEPTVVPIILGTPVTSTSRNQVQYRFQTGIRKLLTSGGEISVSTELTRLRDSSPGLTLFPDPAYNSSITLGFTQPLLRGFGTSVNTAAIRLARNTERSSIQQLRADLLLLLETAEGAYWELVFAWDNLEISEWLLEVGVQVRDIMDRRRDFDTRPAEYSDAVARVEQRKSQVIQARRAIRRASDRLKLLINDPALTVGSEALLVPADRMIEQPIRYNLREAVMTAVANRPEIEQAILGIDDASIRQMLADNNRLPLLNVSAELAYFGLSSSADSSYSNLFQGNFIDYIFGMVFEWPIGNRAAEAGYRQSRLERSASVIAYQRAVQQVVLDVKTALRDCITSYELIQASRSNRIAQAENLRTLLVEEETLAGLTPEFLNLKFQRQDRLAEAQQEEIQSLVNYNTSVAGLYRAMGVGLEMNRIELEIVDPGADTGGAGNASPARGE